MKSVSENNTSTELCDEMLMSMFENIIEFNASGTVKCLKVSPQLDFLPQEPLRILTEDFIRYISGHFVFEDNEFSFSSLQTRQNGITFSILQNGEEIKYMGFIIPFGENCCFCFNRVDSIANSPGDCESTGQKHPVFIKTFGYFEVYKDGHPILFHSEKVKELLALLVDRQGGYITTKEGAALLWPDEEMNDSLQARYRKVSMRLTETLSENGIEYIVDISTRKRRIVPENFDCDFYEFLNDPGKDRSKFPDFYLKDYFWSSDTRRYYSNIKPKI